MRRDVQKSRVYRAEDCMVERHAKPFTTMLEVWTYCERVERDPWFRRHYGRRKFRIKDGRGTRIARGGWDKLNLPRWSRKPLVILHEIAHCVAPAGCRHGWEFCAEFLKLVRHFMGKDVHDRLRAAMRVHRAKYKRPMQKRVLSEFEKAALRDRLEQWRAKQEMAASTNPHLHRRID